MWFWTWNLTIKAPTDLPIITKSSAKIPPRSAWLWGKSISLIHETNNWLLEWGSVSLYSQKSTVGGKFLMQQNSVIIWMNKKFNHRKFQNGEFHNNIKGKIFLYDQLWKQGVKKGRSTNQQISRTSSFFLLKAAQKWRKCFSICSFKYMPWKELGNSTFGKMPTSSMS